MTTNKSVLAFTAFAATLLLTTACDRDSANRAQGAADTAGQKIDRALDETGKKLAEAGERIKPGLERAGEKISAAADKTGEKISETAQQATAGMKDSVTSGVTISTGERTSVSGISPETRATLEDTAITASIKADYLKDPDLSVLRIDVDTTAGVVTLNGSAESDAARKRAELLASAQKGVKQVRNYLIVKRG